MRTIDTSGSGLSLAESAIEERSRTVDESRGLARLILGAARVAELGAQSRKQSVLLRRFGRHEPEEGVVFDAHLPQPLGRLVIGQLESDRRLVLFKLAGPDFDVEPVASVGYLQNFRPGESVDAQAVLVDEQAGGAHAQENVDGFGVARLVQVHSVHGQLFGILQVVQFGFFGRLRLVGAVKFGHLLLQFDRLVGRQTQLVQVLGAAAVVDDVVVAQFGLDQIGAEQCVRHERARQSVRRLSDIEKREP